jgi:hypothetical protein
MLTVRGAPLPEKWRRRAIVITPKVITLAEGDQATAMITFAPA